MIFRLGEISHERPGEVDLKGKKGTGQEVETAVSMRKAMRRATCRSSWWSVCSCLSYNETIDQLKEKGEKWIGAMYSATGSEVMNFGKYQDLTFTQVFQQDESYTMWAIKTSQEGGCHRKLTRFASWASEQKSPNQPGRASGYNTKKLIDTKPPSSTTSMASTPAATTDKAFRDKIMKPPHAREVNNSVATSSDGSFAKISVKDPKEKNMGNREEGDSQAISSSEEMQEDDHERIKAIEKELQDLKRKQGRALSRRMN